jgi:hypothetical protein
LAVGVELSRSAAVAVLNDGRVAASVAWIGSEPWLITAVKVSAVRLEVGCLGERTANVVIRGPRLAAGAASGGSVEGSSRAAFVSCGVHNGGAAGVVGRVDVLCDTRVWRATGSACGEQSSVWSCYVQVTHAALAVRGVDNQSRLRSVVDARRDGVGCRIAAYVIVPGGGVACRGGARQSPSGRTTRGERSVAVPSSRGSLRIQIRGAAEGLVVVRAGT